MHAQPVAEIRDIVIPAFARIVGHMEGDATVDAHDEELQVVAQTETRPEGEVLQEAAPLHLPARAARVVVYRPDIPGIEEWGSGTPGWPPTSGRRSGRCSRIGWQRRG